MAVGGSHNRHTGVERSGFTLVLKLIITLKQIGIQSIEETKHDFLAKPPPLFVPEWKKNCTLFKRAAPVLFLVPVAPGGVMLIVS